MKFTIALARILNTHHKRSRDIAAEEKRAYSRSLLCVGRVFVESKGGVAGIETLVPFRWGSLLPAQKFKRASENLQGNRLS